MVDAITSPDNEKVKYLRSLHEHDARQRACHFLVEGVRLLEEALNSGLVPELVLVDEAALERTPRGRNLLARLRPIGYLKASDRAVKAAAETITPQGVVAAVPFPPEKPYENSGTALVIDGVQDPGNLGTILRSAEATTTAPVLLAPGTVDAFSPKVVRAGMGAHFRLPIRSANYQDIAAALTGREVWVAEPRGGVPYYDVDWTRPSALIVGSEARGPGDEARRLATGRLTIPMAGPTESLNAAVAASVIMFESLRQRRWASEREK